MSLVLVLLVVLAYAGSFRAPFLFDDGPAIVENPAFRPGSSLTDLLGLTHAEGQTTSGRPIVNLSLALNHALGGQQVWGYHAFNLAVHALAGLTLFGIVRRTLIRRDRERAATPEDSARIAGASANQTNREASSTLSRNAAMVAFATAALWLLHPLQTESTTYIVQRAESMAGLFVLLTLYTFIRAVESARPGTWLNVSAGACLLAVGCKEVAVVTPLLILLYDYTFVANSWGALRRERGVYYLKLAATWLVLVALVASTGARGGTAGFATLVTPWNYLLIQSHAIWRYLALAFWPAGQVFDYGVTQPPTWAAAAIPGAILLGGFALALFAVKRRSLAGFVALWFFLTLAPSSSFVPVASQTMAEHRMYLALAAPLLVLVILLWRAARRFAPLVALLLAAISLALTWQRNTQYASALSIWSDTAQKYPANPRAHHNLGLALLDAGRFDDARRAFEAALALKPDAADTRFALGNVLTHLQRPAEARQQFEQAVALHPNDARLQNNLGNNLLDSGDAAGARRHYEAALRLDPNYAPSHQNLANALLDLGDADAALREAETATRLDPASAEAHFTAGNASATLGRFPAAQTHYETALRLRPAYAEAHHNLANVLLELNRPDEAIAHLNEAVALQPDYLSAHRTLALVFLKLGRRAQAVPHLEILARANPSDPDLTQALREARR